MRSIRQYILSCGKICVVYTSYLDFYKFFLIFIVDFSIESLPLFFSILCHTYILFPAQYSISSPTPDIQVTELLIKLFPFPLSLCKMPVAHLLWAHHSDVTSSDPERKLHVLVFILNLATHILHPFSSSKVNKNKFRDFLKSLIFLSHESAEMSNSRMFDESWQPVHHCWKERTSHYLCQGDVWLPSALLKKITASLVPGVNNRTHWTYGYL